MSVRPHHITLVPASLLPYKRQYQRLAHTLPAGAVLLIVPRRRRTQRRLLVQLAGQFARSHPVTTRTVEEVQRFGVNHTAAGPAVTPSDPCTRPTR